MSNRFRSLTLASAACVLFAGGAAAKESKVRWSGVWQGTVGGSEVQLCLEAGETPRAAYYYRKHLSLIAIEVAAPGADEGAVALREHLLAPKAAPGSAPPAEARWDLVASPDGTALSGSWRDAHKTLPLKLSRVAWSGTTENTTACTSDAFNQLREQPGRVTTKDALLHGVPYRVLSLDFGQRYEVEVASFELLRDTQGVRRFNAAQRRALHDQEREVFECGRADDALSGMGPDYSSSETPKIITEHWAVVEQNAEWTCGGPHPDSRTTVTTWRLDAGDKVDVWSWFTPAAAAVKEEGQGADRYRTVVLGKPLRDLVTRRWRRSVDCRDAIASTDEWQVYPTDKGLGFLPNLAHVDQACEEEVVLPWARVLPLLNGAGQEAAASFRAEAGRLLVR